MSVSLAPYAVNPSETRGRLYTEEESPMRSVFQRDRDRIIHSAAFRRLEYKTQVFVNHEGDHYRTRLTHSIEVAQIARSLARDLGLCEDLAEGLALAHDLGHTPFGHAGEDAMNAVMQEYGGFDHNAQTIKILTQLEVRYADFDGLNLSWETLEGIAKHNGPLRMEGNKDALPRSIVEYDERHDLRLDQYASAEAQAAALADDIAYNNHDIDDALRAGLFPMEALYDVPLVGDIFRDISLRYQGISPQRLIHEALRRIIDCMVRDVSAQTKANITEYGIKTLEDIHGLGKTLVRFSDEMQVCNRSLKAFLMENMYKHYKVNRMTSKAQRVVSELFQIFHSEPQCLPDDWRKQAEQALEKGGKILSAEVVADYIAGMTDRYALQEHQRLFDLSRV